MEACHNSYLSKNYIVARFSSGWSETQSLFSKQSLKKYLVPLGALVTSKTQDVSDTPIVGDDKIGVLLLNLGGPETLEDVQPFLFNLFADPVMSLLLFLICIK
jgi:ferrochelatase